MIERIKKFFIKVFWSAKDCYESMTRTQKIVAGVGNIVFLFLFYFLGIPKVGFFTLLFGFVVVELFYLVLVYFIKTHLTDY